MTIHLTHCLLVDSSTLISWTSPFVILGVSGLFCFYFIWKILFANTVDPDQTPHYVAPDLDLHCLPMILLRVSRLEWVNVCAATFDNLFF